jgi:CheY-like chemotaxis protein/two-component sensor histidine kinase
VSEILSRGHGGEAELREIGDLLGRQVTQLSRLVDDLLDLSRISTGRIELRWEAVDLSQVLERALDSVRDLIEEHGHEVVVVRSDPLRVHGDDVRLTQCVSNLLANAAKYMDRGGQIRITLERRSDGWGAVRVDDDGVGISQAMLPKVFDLFAQEHRTLDRSKGGLGIGLSLVQRLVHMHGGSVVAESAGLGAGASFEILLPLGGVAAEADVAEEESGSSGRRVLVVDDNVDMADSLTELLRMSGHVTEAVYDGLTAVERAAAFDPDVVLLDIGLPGLDGYAVARHLRDAGAEYLIVAVTGYGQDRDVRQAYEVGFDHHLTKPVEFATISQLIADSA